MRPPSTRFERLYLFDPPMNLYQHEQFEALGMVRRCLTALAAPELHRLQAKIADYLDFRTRIAAFLAAHFADICAGTCYQTRLSACCTRDGILAFFADVVINALVSQDADLDRLEAAIQTPEDPAKCVFLSETGCLWRVKPIVCEMFLCDAAEAQAFARDPAARKEWAAFKAEEKTFTWPDRPVLFEALEAFFMDRGCDSPLMYLHHSPGLVRVRRQRGV